MYFSDDGSSPGVKPVEDKNAPTPPIPSDHTPATPEYLKELTKQLDACRNRLSEISAELWDRKPHFGKKGYQSRVAREIELKEERQQLEDKESAYMYQLREAQALLLTQNDISR